MDCCTKLGLFNFASAAVNFSQFINVGAALNDYGYAAKGLKRALNPSAMDEKIIEASGLLEDINMTADNGGYTQRRGGHAGTAYQKAKHLRRSQRPIHSCARRRCSAHTIRRGSKRG